MPILDEHRDEPEAVMLRSAQEDPWVMYLVVRQDVVPPVSATAILLAGAQATMQCADTYAETSAWQDAFEQWAARSFRKVSLRAKGNAWVRLSSYDAGVGRVGDTDVVRALPPRLRSACDSFLRNLQVYNPDPASLPAEIPGEPTSVDPAAMTFVLNPNARMSVGKQVAQVAHAVLMCAWSPWARDPRYADAFGAWRAKGYPGRFAPASTWARLRATGDGVVVRDAGLTEVDPGTETVLALPPGWVE